VRRDVPLLLGVSMATWGMASGGRLTWQAGLALLAGTVMNVIWEMHTANEHSVGRGDDLSDERSSGLVAAASAPCIGRIAFDAAADRRTGHGRVPSAARRV
jgi:cation:H+ antiporter